MVMQWKSPVGKMILVFILMSGAGMSVGQWHGDDSQTMIGILMMLNCVAILLGEIVVRIDRMTRPPIELVLCEQGIHGYRQVTPSGVCPWCAWENMELRREAEENGEA